jgi:hypothetical protein
LGVAEGFGSGRRGIFRMYLHPVTNVMSLCHNFRSRPYGRKILYEDEVEVTLRPTVIRPVSLDARPPSRTSAQFFFLLHIFFRQLRVCYFVESSLTRGRVCNLLLLLVLASAVMPGLPREVGSVFCHPFVSISP